LRGAGGAPDREPERLDGVSGMTPAVFFGHGSPLNAVRDNACTRAWQAFGRALAPPRAVLCISAHWYLRSTRVTAMTAPRTIHDFSGFPPELYRIEYPAPGAPDLAARVQELLVPVAVTVDEAWGLDHGCWSVLRHVFPRADIPVVQLSIDATQPPAFHYALGRRLAPLRHSGILLAGSGGLVHHLGRFRSGDHVPAQDWARRAEQRLAELLTSAARDELVNVAGLGEDILEGIPTPDHYLPLLYILGASEGNGQVLCRGIEGGSISLLSARFDG